MDIDYAIHQLSYNWGSKTKEEKLQILTQVIPILEETQGRSPARQN
ncbi:hypothetical protein [Neptunomonas sp. XY-337]|nr:hypothetical protein [Neptunomonas sp. XY-337]